MAKVLPDILGRWRIVEMDGRDPNDAKYDVPAFIEFEPDGGGEFQFAYVQGYIDHRLVEREGRPAVEWTWHGNDEMDEVSGRGWAVLHPDRSLRGMFFIHQGGETDFVAKKVGARRPGAFSKPAAPYTTRQGQFLAFIYQYTKLNGQPPAEVDIQRHFQITPPSVHQMILMLEKRGLIERTPGQARSIRLLLPREQLPKE
jgi:hypothetical protein